jgi:hypothetical protein
VGDLNYRTLSSIKCFTPFSARTSFARLGAALIGGNTRRPLPTMNCLVCARAALSLDLGSGNQIRRSWNGAAAHAVGEKAPENLPMQLSDPLRFLPRGIVIGEAGPSRHPGRDPITRASEPMSSPVA